MLDNVGDNRYADEIKSNIAEWRLLMSRTHYSYAKAQGDEELCQYIMDAYSLAKAEKSTLKDSRDYIASGMLGDNFEGVDTILRFIYKKSKDVSVNYDKSDKYVTNSMKAIEKALGIKIVFSKDAQIVIPKRKTSLKHKVLHSRFVVSVGMMLFPKGSKLRRTLKNKL